MWNLFSKKIKNSKSNVSNTGYKGVTFRKELNKYQSQVTLSKKSRGELKAKMITLWSSRFDTLKEAIKAREKYIDNLY